MFKLSTAYVLLLGLASSATAMWPEEWIIGNTCQQVASVNFDSCTSQAGECLCGNLNYLATVAQCIQSTMNSTLQREKGWEFVTKKGCKMSTENSDVLYKQASDYLETSDLTFLEPDFNRTDVFNGPLVFPPQSIQGVYKSILVNLQNKDTSVWEGSILVMIFTAVILIASLSNFLHFVIFKFGSSKQVMGRPSRLMRLCQQYFLIPACFNTVHIDRIYLFDIIPLFVPTRMESIIIGIYGICAFSFLFGPYNTMLNNPLWSTTYAVSVLNVSNRAGIIATIQIPLLTLFALRNNVLIWATGWSFATFNAYHRAIARVTFLMIIVHAAGKQLMMLTFHVPLAKILYPELLYRLGVTALGLMAVMIIFSFIRTNYYELFLAIHIGGAFSAYLTALFHLKRLGYQQAIYVSLALWAADWLIRIFRLTFINFSIFLDPVPGSGRITTAQVSLLESDVINIKVHTPIKWRVTPGQYVFIHFPEFNIFQSHPFSVVGPSDDGESFQLMCKTREGITKRIQQHLASNSKEGKYSTSLSALIEGPYGSHCPVERYETVVLVAGGIGITGIIPYVEYLSQNQKKQQVVLIWTVAKVEEFSWIKDRLQKLARTGRVELCLYATQTQQKEDPVIYEVKDRNSGYALSQRSTSSDYSKNPYQVEVNREDAEEALDHFKPSRVSDIGRETRPVERKRNSIYRHIKSFSQGSARFHVDSAHRSENVDGPGAVEWPAPRRQSVTNDAQHSRFSRNTQIMSAYSKYPVNPYQQFRDADPYEVGPHVQNTLVVPQLQSYAWADFIRQGRPNLPEFVSELFLKSGGSVAVVGCGPAKMMDSLRQAVVVHLNLVSNGRADYYEEAFTW